MYQKWKVCTLFIMTKINKFNLRGFQYLAAAGAGKHRSSKQKHRDLKTDRLSIADIQLIIVVAQWTVSRGDQLEVDALMPQLKVWQNTSFLQAIWNCIWSCRALISCGSLSHQAGPRLREGRHLLDQGSPADVVQRSRILYMAHGEGDDPEDKYSHRIIES